MKKMSAKMPLDFIATFMNARNPREKMMLVTFGILVILAADVFFWLMPVVKTISETTPALSSLQEQLDELREDKKNTAAIQQKWTDIQKELVEKEKGFEASNQLPSLLENLSKLAASSGLKITSLKPIDMPTSSANKLYFSVPITIQATATTHELGSFLSKLETGDTFFKVSDLKINTTTTNPRRHQVEMMVETYRKA